MAKLGISTGTVPNDGMGDSLLDGAVKINSNFNEIYNHFGDGTSLTAIGGTWVATTVGIHTLKNVGIGTTNPTSTLTVKGNADISGILTSSSAQISSLSGTNSNYSGVSTVGSLSIGANQVISSGRQLQNIASLDATTTATIESAIQSAPNDFSNLNVSGVSTLGNTVVGGATTQLVVNGDTRITGILTIGSSSITLDGISNSIKVGSGVTIDGNAGIISATSIFLDGTVLTGAAVTSITAGSGISVDQSTGNVTITATGGGGGGESYWTSTTAGIHTLSNVGIGTTNPTSALTVQGDVKVSGFSTFRNNVNFGTQCSISTSGNSLTISADGDITLASWQGSTKITSQGGANLLSVGAASGDVSLYYQVSAGPSGSEKRLQTLGTGVTVTGTTFTNQLSVSGVSTFSGNTGIGTTNPTSKLVVSGDVNISGVITASSFIGDGSGLTGVVGSGSGVVIKDSGSTVGTAGTIDFGDNLTVSPISAGVVTVTASGGGGGSSPWVTTAAGIHTLSDVGIGTTSPGGYKLKVYNGSFGLQFPGKNPLDITQLGDDTFIIRTSGNDPITIAPGNTVRLSVNTSGASVTGVLTATSFSGPIQSEKFYSGGVITSNTVLSSSDVNSLIPVSTGSSITVTLPAGSGLGAGDGFRFVDVGVGQSSSGNAATYNITITPNASDRIMGGPTGDSFIIDQNGASVKLVWMGSTYDWRIV